MQAGDSITHAIRAAKAKGSPAIVGYVTAGFPSKESFRDLLNQVDGASDVIEIGVPFTDPMADGPTIQRSSRAALAQGVSLRWILEELTRPGAKPQAPLVLMSYLNPLLAFGLDKLSQAAAEAGLSGFVVPDLPFEECDDLRRAFESRGLALVQLVTPVTPQSRLKMLCEGSGGFVYAVTMTGTTGKSAAIPQDALDYFARVQAVSPLPVCAGFGIRNREQVARLAPHVDGVIVASALVEAIERGEDPAALLRSLRG
jgi:tryptophan synthase alpha chain